jgi:hypothetical protein
MRREDCKREKAKIEYRLDIRNGRKRKKESKKEDL